MAYAALYQLRSRGTLGRHHEERGVKILKRHTWSLVCKDKSKKTMLQESGSRNSLSSPMKPKEAGEDGGMCWAALWTRVPHSSSIRPMQPSPRPDESLQTFGSKFGALSLSRSLSNGDLNCHGHGHGHLYLVGPPRLPGGTKSILSRIRIHALQI